ncbi:unnamed protein product [Phyllotreta striolata]|uniref:Major facilitator superfamily (MFS) profile domain-containing protein n=1 Tax=Phyllotreta striolata TaxID=444603 RepID=A0A9N9TMK8_PHYSR|nr:unnamed protein product [Phyllotreta striolata]
MTITKFYLTAVFDSKDVPQICAIVLGCIPSFITGLIIAWPSPSVVQILKSPEIYDITAHEASYFSILNAIGPVLFSVLVSRLCDRLGRKRTLMISAPPHLICWFLKAFCADVKWLYAARIVGGIGDSFMYNSLPMYIGEISTPRVRGVWGNGLICSLYFGLFSISLIGSYCSVRTTALICAVFPALFLVSFAFMPESPYFYAMHERDEDTIDSLKRLRGTEDVTEEFKRLKFDVKRQMSEPGTWRDVFTIESNKKAIVAGVFLRVSQNFCGLLAFPVYAQYIFERAGDSFVDPKISSIIYTGLSVVCYVTAANFSDKLGRRNSYIISMCLTCIPLSMEGLYFLVKEQFPQIDLASVQFLPLAAMIILIVIASLGVGLVPTLMLGELFSASVKVKCLSIVTTFFSLSYFMANNLFYYASHFVGLYAPFFIFAVSNIFSAIMAARIIPETKGKTLEEIQQQLKTQKNMNCNA